MSRFSKFFAKITSIAFVSILLFSIIQFPVSAQDDKTQTGSSTLTESGSIIELQPLQKTNTGEILLEQNSQNETSSGADLIKHQMVIETDVAQQNFLKRFQRTQFYFKNDDLGFEEKTKIEQKLIQLAEGEYHSRIEGKLQDFKNNQKGTNQNLRQKSQKLEFNKQTENVDKFKKEKNNLAEINAELKTELENVLAEILTREEREQIEIEANYLFELQEEVALEVSLEEYTEGVVPNDPQYANQWGMKSIVVSSQLIGETERSTSNTYLPIIALIDTGVDYTHEDLQGQFWTNENCVDDLNERIAGGCLYGGYDFVDEDNNPFASDGYAHGTQVAGILAAKTNNELGMASLSNNQVQLMSLRVAEDGILEQDKIIRAIYFAVNNGADMINMSFGGPTYSENLKTAIAYAQSQGVIVVASAGNYGNNNDVTPIYPASYDLDNIVSVGAIDQNDALASFSDYGVNSVDIVAPGVGVLTTGLNDTYVQVSGTSFSTPFMASAYVYYVNVVREFVEEIF